MRHQYAVHKASEEKSRDQNHDILPQVSIFKAQCHHQQQLSSMTVLLPRAPTPAAPPSHGLMHTPCSKQKAQRKGSFAPVTSACWGAPGTAASRALGHLLAQQVPCISAAHDSSQHKMRLMALIPLSRELPARKPASGTEQPVAIGTPPSAMIFPS